MLTIRRITFKLYPSKAQAAKLHWARKMHQILYNAAITNRRTQYKKFNHSVDYFEQQNSLPDFKQVWPEYAEFGCHTLQATLKRVDFAFQRFFNGLGGYPKYKAMRRMKGWTYPSKQSWKAHTEGKHGHLELRDLGIKMKMRGQARTWGTPTTCTIMFKDGCWYASITVKCDVSRDLGMGDVGIDLGCKQDSAITLSSGEQHRKPAFIAASNQRVKWLSKQQRRKRSPNREKRVRGSRRWKQWQRLISATKRKRTRQTDDWAHQITSDIVSRNSLVAGEQLNIKGMTRKPKKGSKRKRQKSGLNRSILEVGMGRISKYLEYKLAEGDGIYVESPTRKLKPSQRCAKCWELTPKTLSDRLHVCSNLECGHVEDRDVNAAQVNLTWARGQELVPSSAAKSPSSTSCGSMKQLGALKRAQKLRLLRSKAG